MKCIVGLGNIGKEYTNTRHNIGFMFVDYVCEKYGIKIDKKKTKFMYAEGNINGEKVVFVKPTTFMNLSGEAIVQAINWYKLDLKDICIVYDDVDILFGDVRYREKGSGGTHNGMKNIIQTLKTEDIARIRLGIENRNGKPIELIDYVLGKFSKEEMSGLEAVFEEATKNMLNFLTNK